MKSRFLLIGSLLVLIFALFFPRDAQIAVAGAMDVWAGSFVPALLPVFIVTPALTCPDAVRLYEDVFSKFTQKLFGVPGRAAGAIVIGIMAGSPAGAISLSGIGLNTGERSRAGIMVSCLSPVFISSQTAILFASVKAGLIMALCEVLAVLSAGWLLKDAWKDDVKAVEVSRQTTTLTGGMCLSAVNISGVLCWMALFSVIARMISKLLPGLGSILPPFLEIASGMKALAAFDVTYRARLLLAAFFSGLGGLCVALQNLSRLKGMPYKRLMLGKLLHATLTALYFPLFSSIGGGFSALWPSFTLWIFFAGTVAVFLACSIRRKFNVFRLTSNTHEVIID